MGYLIIVPVIILLYFFMICPNLFRKKKMKAFEEVMLTHRGLFNNEDIPENSLSAFKKTIENGFGSELDVQLTKDDVLVVFHDISLKRICGVDLKLTDLTYEELCTYTLLNTKEKIPTFKEVLDIFTKDNPLIVEIKPEGRAIETCDRALELLSHYDIPFTMESFNPFVVYHLRRKHKNIIRGQLAYNYLSDEKLKSKSLIGRFILTYLLEDFITRPDYVAYDINNYHNLSFRIISKILKGECVAWTVKSENDFNKVKKYYRQFIFDSYLPEKRGFYETERIEENFYGH